MRTLIFIRYVVVLFAATLVLTECKKHPSTTMPGIGLNKTTLIIPEGRSRALTPATNREGILNWSSSDESVATVSSAGIVTAVAQGKATITVSTLDGRRKTQCAVMVVLPTMTMSITAVVPKYEKIFIRLAGTGEAYIDWGDDSERETVTLEPDGYNLYTHVFSDESISYTIYIDGGNITLLDCSYEQLTDIDVTNNPALHELSCRGNQLTSLDVTNNPALRDLDGSYNQFEAEGLDALFGTLHGNDIGDRRIDVSHNPGAYDCDTSIAVRKGWEVEAY